MRLLNLKPGENFDLNSYCLLWVADAITKPWRSLVSSELEVKWVRANVADAAAVHIGSLVISPSCFSRLNLTQSQRRLAFLFLSGKWPHRNVHNLMPPFKDGFPKPSSSLENLGAPFITQSSSKVHFKKTVNKLPCNSAAFCIYA